MFRANLIRLVSLSVAFIVGALGMRVWLSHGDLGWDLSGQSAPAEFTKYYAERREFLRRQIRNTTEGAALFLGDSRFDSLNVSAVLPGAVNLGIGGETTERLLVRIADYQPFDKWGYLVICVGFNDAKFRSPSEAMSNVKRIVNLVAGSSTIFLIAALPADEVVSRPQPNNFIVELNSLLEQHAEKSDGVEFIDAGTGLTSGKGLLPSVHIGDGVHLNQDGQAIFMRNLRRLLPNAAS